MVSTGVLKIGIAICSGNCEKTANLKLNANNNYSYANRGLAMAA